MLQIIPNLALLKIKLRNMIAIADGGSTKCDWVILDENGKTCLQTVTNGFNPNIIPAEKICGELEDNQELSALRSQITKVFYYGSGCGVQHRCELVKGEFAKFFTAADILVDSDTVAAAYAAYNGRPAIVCILGTGSNSCFFDGKNIRTDLPSLGFLIGDEGSGSAFGKLLLKRFFMKKLPPDLEAEFQQEYSLTIDEVLKNIYHNSRANAYLGGFNKFVAERKNHLYFREMIFEELKNFLNYQVLPYPEARTAEINFIGYVAFIYEEILRDAGEVLNLNIGTIVRKPIENLVNYHKNYILIK